MRFARSVPAVGVLCSLVFLARTALGAEPPPASPLLPPDHWGVKAAQRLHEIGLAPGWLPAQRAVPLVAVGRTLAEAAERAEREAPPYAVLARAWDQRFRREFPRADRAGAGEVVLAGASVGAGVLLGEVRANDPGTPAPAFVALTVPRDGPVADLSAAALLGDHLAAGARLHANPWDAELSQVELVGALGSWALSLGRGPAGYGPNEVGAVVASGAASIDRLELMTAGPVRLPGALDGLGDLAFDTVLARFSEPRHPYHPLLWAFQLQWRPHPRLTLGLIRGVLFGGSLWSGISLGDALLSISGLKNTIGNNVYSASVQYRIPMEDLFPLTAKLEWGSDDNPGAAAQWPGFVFGLSAPMLPGLPVGLGVEYAYFGRGPFGYHDPFGWYAHGQYVGGWVTGQTPLGDPLGGNGRALRLTAAADLWDGRLRLSGMAWIQDRFAANLYAPAAAGRSLGGRAEAELRFGEIALGARAAYEGGQDGWKRGLIEGHATLFY